jgi:arabinofuranosyltransferase
MRREPAFAPTWAAWTLGVAVALAAFAGWRLFYFLSDDAFIAFRYASNALRGHGLVWNPPPFAPVEGYTSFLWVRLLEIVWRLTGVAPPQAANALSFGFGLATLAIGARMLARMSLPPGLAPHRLALLALVMLGALSNRTFLAWLSSGLETAMFNFGLTAWLYLALAPRADRGTRWVLWLSAATAFLALCRPDGLLFGAAWAAMLVLHWRENGPFGRSAWFAATPVLLVPTTPSTWSRGPRAGCDIWRRSWSSTACGCGSAWGWRGSLARLPGGCVAPSPGTGLRCWGSARWPCTRPTTRW